MDHLLVPPDNSIGPLHIPYICTQEYEGGSWLDFPRQAGWIPPDDDSAFTFTHNGKEVQDIRAVAGFLQTWLYFGMLDELTGQHTDPELFHKTGSDGKSRFDSTALIDIVVKWSQKAMQVPVVTEKYRSSDNRGTDSWIQSKFFTLMIMHSTCTDIANAYINDCAKRLDDDSDVLSGVLLSVFALGDYLDQTICHLARSRGCDDDDSTAWTLSHSIARSVTSKMRGWCPNRIASFMSRGVTAGVLWYFANLEPPKVHDNHNRCTSMACVSLDVDHDEYIVRHTSQSCSCRSLYASKTLQDVVAKDRIALFTVESFADTATLVMHDVRDTTVYVAISHVWADGHGNLTENALPLCFLHQLQAKADALGLTPGAHVPIWMDTICLPRFPNELRRKAISVLDNVFINATTTLVIESYLEAFSSGLTPLDLLARVSVSFWTSRLWTFSEGQLSKNLHIQLEDKAIDFYPLMKAWQKEIGAKALPSKPLTNLALKMMSLYSATNLLRTDEDSEDSQIMYAVGAGQKLQLSQAKAALTSRQTSFASDEALCLGTLFELDLTLIQHAKNEEKIAAFWRLMRHLPIKLIFTHCPLKVEDSGTRWAPATLLGSTNEQLTKLPDFDYEDYATPSVNGLQLCTPSMTFDAAGADSLSFGRKFLVDYLQHFAKEAEAHDYDLKLIIQDQFGIWYTCTVEHPWHQTGIAPLENATPEILLLEDDDSDDSDEEEGSISPLLDDELDDEWGSHKSYRAVFVTHTSSSQSPSVTSIMATAHTHLSIDMFQLNDWKYFTAVAACAQEVLTLYPHIDLDNDFRRLGSDKLRAVIDKHEALTDPFRHLSENIAGRKVDTSDYSAVVREAVKWVERFCRMGRWYKVTLHRQRKAWCID